MEREGAHTAGPAASQSKAPDRGRSGRGMPLRRPSLPPAGASVWDAFLWSLKVEDLWGSDRFKDTERLRCEAMQKLWFVRKEDSLLDVLLLLTQKSVLSVPVYDDDANMFVGSVDVIDLVTFCIKQRSRGRLLDDAELKLTEAGRIVNISGRNRWTPLDRRMPLRILLDTLSLPDVHRVPVIDNQGTFLIDTDQPLQKVLGLVTQSKVLEWLREQRKRDDFPKDVLQLKLRDWKSPVICGTDMLWLARQHTTLADAFRTIKRERVTGVAVVNEKGELIGNVSASDIKVIVSSGRSLLDLLAMSMDEFLRLKASIMVDLRHPLSRRVPITATADDTMDQVLDKLSEHRIHRLWIVAPKSTAEPEDSGSSSLPADEPESGGTSSERSGKKRKREIKVPIGCVSLCDVLNELAGFESAQPLNTRAEMEYEGYIEDEEEDQSDEDFLEPEQAVSSGATRPYRR